MCELLHCQDGVIQRVFWFRVVILYCMSRQGMIFMVTRLQQRGW